MFFFAFEKIMLHCYSLRGRNRVICVKDWRKGAYGIENGDDSDQPSHWKRGV